ncbi:Sec-independent protein translocase protein TatB [Brevundimonas sp.]|uniref:Sec-independent protein translocase protein TatB n=1 Tax=Brevundimonas sp. TaxID=1871086 RepID=UPI003BAC18EC
MGGLGPGIGGSEWFIIGLVALLVVGPERLPGLLRQLGKMVAKARGMANEFRASFDEMARQSELDELRKEVEALRTGQGAYSSPVQLGAEANAVFKDISSDLNKPLFAATPAAQVPAAATPAQADTPAATTEWPDGEPVMLPISEPSLVEPHPVTPKPAKATRAKAAPAKAAPAKTALARKAPTKTAAAKTAPAKTSAKAVPAAAKPSHAKPAAAKPKTPRAAPRKAKLDL